MEASGLISWRVEIFTDEPLHHPGDLVTGRVFLTLKRKLQFDRLYARLRGVANVEFEEKEGGKHSHSTFPPPPPIVHKNEKELVNLQSTLWTQEKAVKETIRRASRASAHSNDADFSCPWGLEAGEHEFSFEFRLPADGLFTSFDAANSPAHVRYAIEVISARGMAEIKRGEVLVAVVCPRVLAIEKPLVEPRPLIQTKEIPKAGRLTVQLSVARTSFLPGAAVQGEITIHNQTKKSVKYANLSVVHRISCFSSIHRHEFEVPTAGMPLPAHKVRSGCSFGYAITFNIPALVPALNIPNVLYSAHFLRLAVGFHRNAPKAAVMFLELPIEIGTEIDEVTSVQLPPGPPAYDELDFGRPEAAGTSAEVAVN